jgi:hypothetical protein
VHKVLDLVRKVPKGQRDQQVTRVHKVLGLVRKVHREQRDQQVTQELKARDPVHKALKVLQVVQDHKELLVLRVLRGQDLVL